jgi:hypothetical protein
VNPWGGIKDNNAACGLSFFIPARPVKQALRPSEATLENCISCFWQEENKIRDIATLIIAKQTLSFVCCTFI